MRGIIAALVGVLLGAGIGGWWGARWGMGNALDECVARDAGEIRARVKALQGLRAGDRDAAIETLESDLDDALIILDPGSPYPGLRQPTLAAVDLAIRESKQYRALKPRQSKRPMVDRMVADLFSRRP